MIKLILDTSNRFLYFAIIKDEKILMEKKQEGNNNHSETLIDTLKTHFESLNLSPDDLDEIYVGEGPGSYTGVRVACTVAKVLAFIKNKRLFAFSSLDLLMSSALNRNGEYVGILNARREHSYAKAVQIQDKKKTILLNDSYIENEKLKSLYPNFEYFDSNSSFDALKLLESKSFHEIENLHSFVPVYLRSGV